jgi:hypothetical protein
MMRSAHRTLAAMSLSVRGLPCGVPHWSSSVRMWILVRIEAMIPIPLAAFVHRGILPLSLFVRYADVLR